MREPVGIYIHIPFCRRKCPYCDFYSLPFADAIADSYTDAVCRALRTQPFAASGADTVYFGGGTPSLMGAQRLGQILAAVADAFPLSAGAEISIEANPTAALLDELPALRATGINRISFGVQSLVDSELRALGRRHSAADARNAILAAERAGFAAISADLMLAIPGQTRESLAGSIDGLAALPLQHVSAYLLQIEEGTPFGAQKNALSLPDEDAEADLYLDAVYRLEQHGFAQYEISNFARDGAECRHNLIYWRCGAYLGIGPAAHSHWNGRRMYFPRDLAAFLAAPEPFALLVDDGAGGGFEEDAMLRLRLREGFSVPPDHPAAARLLQTARQLQTQQLVRVRGSTISLTPEGFLLSNSVTGTLLAAIDNTPATDPEYSAAGDRSRR